MSRGELALAFISGGLGFSLADFADRYFATYNPSATTATPTNLFTGGTNGTLANTLNIASPPGLLRIGVGIGVTAVPAIGAYLVKNSMGRAALQGMMLGAGIKLFSTLWNAYVMGNLLKPAATDQATMQASLGARLYPAEVVAKQNLAASPVPYTAPTGLNAPPRQALSAGNRGVAGVQQRPRPAVPNQRGLAGDVGPFAGVGSQQGFVPPGYDPTAICVGGQVADSITGACVAPCSDGSTPANGQCPPTTTAGCGPQQVIDSVTGGCANPCPDGSAPANGVCGATNYPAPQQPLPNPPSGGYTKVNIPTGGSCDTDCGLSGTPNGLPDFNGYVIGDN